MTSNAFVARTARLLKEFDKTVKRVRGVFVARFGDPLTDTMIAETRQEYANLIPQLPDLGGKQPFTQFIISSAWFLAMYRALQRHGFSVEEAGQLIYDMSEAFLKTYPAFLRRLFGDRRFSPRYLKGLQRRAAASQQRQYAGDYVYEFVPGDAQTFDYGVDYTACATCAFYQAQGSPELARYVCAVDKLYSEMLGWGLTRTKTLAEGHDRCDFRFRKGGPTRVNVPVSLRT